MKTEQIKLRLTAKIADEFKSNANILDLSLSQYIKFILIKEIQTFQLSQAALKVTIMDEVQKLLDDFDREDRYT